ncbi:MAG: hypothetical protein JJU28_15690 [Cyclobacteriaceae bacterium]|nr:hypothetical protein [Cyclobacteriaceae bacterium]
MYSIRRFLIFVMSGLVMFSCSSLEDEVDPMAEYDFEPGKIILQTKPDFSIQQVFNFINTYDFEVLRIWHGVYTSGLPNDSLQYILDYFNAKSYTNDGQTWFSRGEISRVNHRIVIRPRLFNMMNREYQQDWLETMEYLLLHASKGSHYTITFLVPEGQEKHWRNHFRRLLFVEWAELNHHVPITHWP